MRLVGGVLIGLFVHMFIFSPAANASKSQGLVGHWNFDEGKGNVARDGSGRNHDGRIIGGAEYVKQPEGYALRLNGSDAYVDCGTTDDVNMGRGTLEVWCYPERIGGGMINWSTGPGEADQRLMMVFGSYGGDESVRCYLATQTAFNGTMLHAPKKNEWSHMVFTYDGKNMTVYCDGEVTGTKAQGEVAPDIGGVPLWLGRCRGWGNEYFRGMLDDVRIYDRAVSVEEIRQSYLRSAEARGKDVTRNRKPGLMALACPGPGKILGIVNSAPMWLIPEQGTLQADLSRPGKAKVVKRLETPVSPDQETWDASFEAEGLEPGEYVLRARVIGIDGARVGDESTVTLNWPGRPDEFRDVKLLNNFVWELLNVKGKSATKDEYVFTQPWDRWVHIRTTAEVKGGAKLWISIDSGSEDAAVIMHSEGETAVLETMRRLSAGEHAIHVAREGDATLKQLVVRSIPILQSIYNGGYSKIRPHYRPDWEFLSWHILPHTNSIVINCRLSRVPMSKLKEWKKEDRHVLELVHRGEDYGHKTGYTHPLFEGVLVDEFVGGGNWSGYEESRETVERLNAAHKDKVLWPYVGARPYSKGDLASKFVRACIDGGGYVCLEWYRGEKPTREKARYAFRKGLAEYFVKGEEAVPGLTRRIVLVSGVGSAPNSHNNVDPSVDYRVLMDMQMRLLATHPALFGLGGVQYYHPTYYDEETLRWGAHLYRHYGIEGNTTPATDDPYNLTHIINPDFTDGTSGWTMVPAKKGSIRVEKMAGYGWLQGRYYKGQSMGNSFLLTKRSASSPNSFSQEIKNLTPGRLYSFKMISADHQDIKNGRGSMQHSDVRLEETPRPQDNSINVDHKVFFRIANAELMPQGMTNFQCPYWSNQTLGRFRGNNRAWMNYYWYVFWAKGAAAKLTVSDWESAENPGGPIGQELMFNFIEIQPYFGE